MVRFHSESVKYLHSEATGPGLETGKNTLEEGSGFVRFLATPSFLMVIESGSRHLPSLKFWNADYEGLRGDGGSIKLIRVG